MYKAEIQPIGQPEKTLRLFFFRQISVYTIQNADGKPQCQRFHQSTGLSDLVIGHPGKQIEKST